MKLAAGQVVIVDWRDALPREPNKRRPAIVVEDSNIFDETYSNTIVVPLTRDTGLFAPGLAVTLAPTPTNRLVERCHALCHHLASVSKLRITPTEGRIAPQELADIRRAIALAIGLDDVP